MKKLTLLLFLAVTVSYAFATDSFWHLNSNNGITWVNDGRAHNDHIEMSGQRMSVVLRYGISSSGSFSCNYGMVWPLLRTIPNNTHASLMRHLAWNALEAVTANQRSLADEKVDSITFNGMMTVYSHYGKLALRHVISPSTTLPALVETFTFSNEDEREVKIVVDDTHRQIATNKEEGVDGTYVIEQIIKGAGAYNLKKGQSVSFSSFIYGRKQNEPLAALDADKELEARDALIKELKGQLILNTPDATLNQMFAFSKIRACESIFATKAGPMHGPGGEAYYAAIWANDQAEYANPFFPFVGYDYANESAMTSWNLFAKWMNTDWKPIPSSIIAEGDDYWNGAGDRGDAAMIAYGASRYALEMGSKDVAEKLWPLISWCLEYCHRQLNDEGVVRSDHDELEGRFPAGTANLITSSLYYDALLSASSLSKTLGKGLDKTYTKQASQLRSAIETYFHRDMKGFDTYRYYDGNTLLRSWICVPLCVGIFDHAKGTLDALFSDHLWTENGLLTQEGDKTFWDRSTLYALRGAFMAGETDRTLKFLKFYSSERLLGSHVPYAIEAWPEGSQRHLSAESALYARVFTEGMFGIRATKLNEFTVSPRLPEDWPSMSLSNVHICGDVVDINVVRQNGDIVVSVTCQGKTTTKKYSAQPVIFKL